MVRRSKKGNGGDTPKRAEAGHRLLDAQLLVSRATGATIDEMIRSLGVSRSTVLRYLDALASRGIRTEIVGTRDNCKVHRVTQTTRSYVVAFTLEELFWQKVIEAYASCFEGTGIDDSFRRVSAKMDATLKPSERARVLDLSRKILDVPDHVHDYADKFEIIDQLLSALLEEQPLMIKFEGKKTERRRIRMDPYTLVTHKRAIYIVGFSHHHKQVRTFAIDGISDATRLRGESFVYPKDYDPRAEFDGAFGLIAGAETEVTLRFDASVDPWLRCRKWHKTQALERKGRFVYLKMRPRGTKELLSWVLGWGSKAAVIAPASLRTEWQKEAEAMVAAAREIAADEERRLGADDDEDDA